jgi:hypothetical protein
MRHEVARLESRHVEKVPDQRVETISGVVNGLLELLPVLGRPDHLLRAQASDRRLDRSQRRTQVVRDGGEQGCTGLVVARQLYRGHGRPPELPSLEDRPSVSGVRGEQSSLVGPQTRWLEDQLVRLVDRLVVDRRAPIEDTLLGDHLGGTFGWMMQERCGLYAEHVDRTAQQHRQLVRRGEQRV